MSAKRSTMPFCSLVSGELVSLFCSVCVSVHDAKNNPALKIAQ